MDKRDSTRGRISVEEGSCLGRHVTANCDAFVAAVKAVFEEDRSKTRREIADEVPVSSSSVHKVLTDKLDKTKTFAKWVPFVEPRWQRRCVHSQYCDWTSALVQLGNTESAPDILKVWHPMTFTFSLKSRNFFGDMVLSQNKALLSPQRPLPECWKKFTMSPSLKAGCVGMTCARTVFMTMLGS